MDGVQNFRLIWVDASIDDKKNKESVKTISKLREITENVDTFADVDECVNFIISVEKEHLALISSGALGQTIVPIVHDMTQVKTIYIFCGDKSRHEEWTRHWSKINGVVTAIEPICQALKKDCQQSNDQAISMSAVAPTTTKKSNELDPSFMYTSILKEILLSIHFEQKHFQQFITFCRQKFADNHHELENVDKLEREYSHHSPVWWYTSDSFLYRLLNVALRTMDFGTIIRFGFFLCDLLKQIAQLHSKQYSGNQHSGVFTVYRSQYVSKADFDQLTAKQGGLLSFNHFLSTVADRDSALQFMHLSTTSHDHVGVLYVMKIDPSVSSVPFANLQHNSCYQNENEILFSMNAVFRVGHIKVIDQTKSLWQVNLTLTSDDDPLLSQLTNRIREDIGSDENAWLRLGQLLIKVGQFDQAGEVYGNLLHETSDERKKATIYHCLASVKCEQGQYADGIELYKKALEIQEKSLPPNHPDLATSYNNIGSLYQKMGEYESALSSQRKALDIFEKSLPANHPLLVACHEEMEKTLSLMGDQPEALSAREKTQKQQ